MNSAVSKYKNKEVEHKNENNVQLIIKRLFSLKFTNDHAIVS